MLRHSQSFPYTGCSCFADSPTMAPKDVELQTNLIVQFLLEDEDVIESRKFQSNELETDSTGDTFDPVLIADKLRTIADAMNEDPKFKVALNDLKQAAAQEAVDVVFSRCVEAVYETHGSKAAEVAPEMQLIKASVAFGLYVKKSAPELKAVVQRGLASFLNRRVGSWVAQQGGWENVPGVSK